MPFFGDFEALPGAREQAPLAPVEWQEQAAPRPSSVRVAVRFRPPLRVDERVYEEAPFLADAQQGRVESADFTHSFFFDRVFDEAATQEDLYRYVGEPVVEDVLEGYHGTVLAYGQTGSGKSYSMFGPQWLGQGSQAAPELQGLVPRAAWHMFDQLEARCARGDEYEVQCSFFEVYCEQLRDLLGPRSQILQVKEMPKQGFYVDGLTHRTASSAPEALTVLREGLRLRAAANTTLNAHSSRSHAIFTLTVRQRIPPHDASNVALERNRKLTLVDLAGSEKVRKSGSTGEMLEEAKKINSSLSALGNVIDALADRRPHIPYRDSRLTRILEESLGGNCRTTLLVACSPSASQASETLSSLRFAARAKKVYNYARVGSKTNLATADRQLLQRISQLQQDLARAHLDLEKRLGAAAAAGAGAGPGLPRSPARQTCTILRSWNENVVSADTAEADDACALGDSRKSTKASPPSRSASASRLWRREKESSVGPPRLGRLDGEPILGSPHVARRESDLSPARSLWRSPRTSEPLQASPAFPLFARQTSDPLQASPAFDEKPPCQTLGSAELAGLLPLSKGASREDHGPPVFNEAAMEAAASPSPARVASIKGGMSAGAEFEASAAGGGRSAFGSRHPLHSNGVHVRSGAISTATGSAGSSSGSAVGYSHSTASLPVHLAPSSPSATTLSSLRNLDLLVEDPDLPQELASGRRLSWRMEAMPMRESENASWFKRLLHLERNRCSALSAELSRRIHESHELQRQLQDTRGSSSTNASGSASLPPQMLRHAVAHPLVHHTVQHSVQRTRSASPSPASHARVVFSFTHPAVPLDPARTFAPWPLTAGRCSSAAVPIFRSNSAGRLRTHLGTTVGPFSTSPRAASPVPMVQVVTSVAMAAAAPALPLSALGAPALLQPALRAPWPTRALGALDDLAACAGGSFAMPFAGGSALVQASPGEPNSRPASAMSSHMDAASPLRPCSPDGAGTSVMTDGIPSP